MMFIYGQSLAGAHRIVGMSFYPLHNDFTPSYFLLSIVIGVTATHLERKGMTAEASHLTNRIVWLRTFRFLPKGQLAKTLALSDIS